MNRIVWVDWAKAIGIVTVVMGHSSYLCPDIVNVIFLFHMPLFFFISGYLFNVNKKLCEITKNNLNTLIIPFLLFNTIGLIANVLQGGIRELLGLETEWKLRFWKPLLNTLLGKAEGMFIGPTWFLLSLVWCKYMMWVITNGKKELKILMIVLVASLLYLRLNTEYYYPYAFDTACGGVIWFAAGYFIRSIRYDFHVNRWIYGVCAFVAFIMEMFLYNYGARVNYISTNMGGQLGILSTVFGIIMIITIAKFMECWKNKYVEAVSRASILIMCLHMILSNYLNLIIHYENHMLITFWGDILVVIILTMLYPVARMYFPALVGNRK